MIILVLIGMVLLIIWQMFHGTSVLQYFYCCKWTLWVGSGWNWCMYPLLVSSQISLISMVFSCLCCCHINKGKFAMLPLFNRLEVLHSASDKPKLIANNLSRSSYLDDAGCSLPVFHCRTNLKQHIISVNPKMVTTNVDSPKVWSWLYSSGGCKELSA